MISAECPEIEVWEDNSILEQKLEKNSNPSIWSIKKVVRRVFRHAESKSGLCLGLSLLLHGVLATFCPTHNSYLLVFRKTSSFWVYQDSQIFQNISPYLRWCFLSILWILVSIAIRFAAIDYCFNSLSMPTNIHKQVN